MFARFARLGSLAVLRTAPSASLVNATRFAATPSSVLRSSLLSSRAFSSSILRFDDYEYAREITPPSSNLFVANIPWEASEGEIGAFFEDFAGFKELNTGQSLSP